MRKRNKGQFVKDPDSHKGRIYALVESGETCRKRMAEQTGITEKQVLAALVNLHNAGRIEVVGYEKGNMNAKRIYGVKREIKASPVFHRVNSVFALGAM